MSATIDCTLMGVGALAFGAGNINAKHDNEHYTCIFTSEWDLV